MPSSSPNVTAGIDRLISRGVIAVMRADAADGLVSAAKALRAGGVEAIEVTLTVPGALEVIKQAVNELGDSVMIGAGTVLDLSQAEAALAAGASFIVSPALDEAVINAAHEASVPAVPGALTPNELLAALRAGAGLVKLFPGRVATPGYFKDVLGPFPGAKLLPTGNVDLVTTPQYIRSGAVAVGVGKALVDQAAIARKDWAAITELAEQFVACVKEARATK